MFKISLFHGTQFHFGTFPINLVMAKKKWTPQTEITDSLLQTRERKKWQIALRRYVMEGQPSSYYAPYFGIDIANFRKWIELQLGEEINWENPSKDWQFEQVIPMDYFDFKEENDLRLCWNFINIRAVKNISGDEPIARVDPFAARAYYESMFRNTGYITCLEMIKKIEQIESRLAGGNHKLENFIKSNRNYLNALSDFSSYEFDRLNRERDFDKVLKEREFLKKYEI